MAQADHGDRRRKKSKTGEDGSYRIAHLALIKGVVDVDGCSFVPQTHSEKLATMVNIQM